MPITRGESNKLRGSDEQARRVADRYAHYLRPSDLARNLVLSVGVELAHKFIELAHKSIETEARQMDAKVNRIYDREDD